MYINYRNGLYQGQLDNHYRPSGNGIAYITESNVFIYSQQWISYTNNNNTIIGSCPSSNTLFFFGHNQYMYGQWKYGKPHGLNVIQLGETIIISYFQNGHIDPKQMVLIVFQHDNLALTMHISQHQEQFRIINKYSILCPDDLLNIIQSLQLNHQRLYNRKQTQQELSHYLSLIRYISYLTSHNLKQNEIQLPKLRLLNNAYYRFGYRKGLAVIFDDSYIILSMGQHNKSTLSCLGIRYEPDKNTFYQGDFQQPEIFCYKTQRPSDQIGRIYSRKLLCEIDFQNQFIKNWGHSYTAFFQTMMESRFITQIKAQLGLRTSSLPFTKVDYLNSSIVQPPAQEHQTYRFLPKSPQYLSKSQQSPSACKNAYSNRILYSKNEEKVQQCQEYSHPFHSRSLKQDLKGIQIDYSPSPICNYKDQQSPKSPIIKLYENAPQKNKCMSPYQTIQGMSFANEIQQFNYQDNIPTSPKVNEHRSLKKPKYEGDRHVSIEKQNEQKQPQYRKLRNIFPQATSNEPNYAHCKHSAYCSPNTKISNSVYLNTTKKFCYEPITVNKADNLQVRMKAQSYKATEIGPQQAEQKKRCGYDERKKENENKDWKSKTQRDKAYCKAVENKPNYRSPLKARLTYKEIYSNRKNKPSPQKRPANRVIERYECQYF